MEGFCGSSAVNPRFVQGKSVQVPRGQDILPLQIPIGASGARSCAVSRSADPVDEDLRDEEQGPPGRGRVLAWFWDLLKTWGPALLTVLVIRSVVAEPFRIPSGSMVPTLEIGDYILVSKFAYGVHFPFTHYKIVPLGQPEHGDIIVFKYPEDPSIDYIKRVVGLPGDQIMVRDNVLYVNTVKQEKQYLDRYQFVDDNCQPEGAKLYQEDLDGTRHLILNSMGYAMPLSEYGPTTVATDSVFVMGDNRDNSSDSRRWGTVPMQNIKGKALVVWLSYDHCEGGSVGPFRLGHLRLSRFGTVLH
jgi:signal peptidase I